jgi:DNA-binding transcriptional LysR family regulator
MELRQLRYFIALAEELHFGRAAERLFISQPPLSQQIRALEEELQVQLFLRTSRSVQLTDAGRAFLEKARVVIQSLAGAVEAAHGARDGSMGRLQVGYIHSASHTLLPIIVRACSHKLPRLQLQLHELDVERQIDALVADRIDVGLIRMPTLHPGVASQRLMTESFMIALPERHHLAKKTSVEVRALAGQPLIAYPGARGEGTFQRALLELCASEHLIPEFSQEASTVQTAVGLVRAGVGLAIVPRSLRSLRLEGVVYREFSGPTPKVSMGVAWRAQRQSSLTESFVRIATQAVAAVRGLGE